MFQRAFMSISILLIDGQTIFRVGMHMLIDAESDLTIVGETVDARDAVGQGLNPGPDLVLLAIDQHEGQHAEAIRSLQTHLVPSK